MGWRKMGQVDFDMNQSEHLKQAEKSLGIGPVEMARLLNTPYNTYKAWKSGRNKLPGVVYVAIDLLMQPTLRDPQ